MAHIIDGLRQRWPATVQPLVPSGPGQLEHPTSQVDHPLIRCQLLELLVSDLNSRGLDPSSTQPAK